MLRIIRRKRLVKRTPELVNMTVKNLTSEIVKYSKGNIPTEVAENMAYRCVAKLDFNNKFHMHRSLTDYAVGMVDNYMQRNHQIL